MCEAAADDPSVLPVRDGCRGRRRPPAPCGSRTSTPLWDVGPAPSTDTPRAVRPACHGLAKGSAGMERPVINGRRSSLRAEGVGVALARIIQTGSIKGAPGCV